MPDSQSSPEVVQRYDTHNGPAARFRLDTGKVIRLEPRETAVVLGWSVESEDFPDTAAHIGQFATNANKVVFARQQELMTTKRRGQRLSRQLGRVTGLELVHVERDDSALVWEPSELSVIADSWVRARELAIDLGANDVAEVTTALSEQL